MNRACLSYWYPKIRGARGVPTPRTEIVETDADLVEICDPPALTSFPIGEMPPTPTFEGYAKFASDLIGACRRISEDGPWFLRTGVFSGKHNWESTCYVTDLEELDRHVGELVIESQIVDLLGLPTNVWAVREFIPLDVHFHAFRGNMPIATEARLFFRDGHVTCVHPYWPLQAFADTHEAPMGERVPDHIRSMDAKVRAAEEHLATTTHEFVAPRFGGEWWSVDWAMGADGRWWLTDMAPGERSWHPEDCPHAEEDPE